METVPDAIHQIANEGMIGMRMECPRPRHQRATGCSQPGGAQTNTPVTEGLEPTGGGHSYSGSYH